VESVLIELKDLSNETENKNDKIIYDPERIKYLDDRLNLLNSLLFKHRVNEIGGLIQLRDELEQKVQHIVSLDNQVEEAEKECARLKNECIKTAAKISASRKKNAGGFEKKVSEILAKLSMPHAALQVDLKESKELNTYGQDEIRFLFRTNKGGDFLELNKVASGGEFARLMLAVKSIIVTVKTLPSIIFDEIDTGVSGEVAHKMGEIMRAMGKSMQVFSITHLPQVAGKGNAHYKVYKETSKNSTHTRIIQLNDDQRVEELARMLSGDKLSDAALANARELMS
jgi:DNA repair protein RecN (Recombination protein N)